MANRLVSQPPSDMILARLQVLLDSVNSMYQAGGMVLKDDTLLAVTDIGLELMRQSDVLNGILCCDEMRSVFCAPVFTQLAHRMEQTKVVNLDELVSCTTEALPIPSELVLRHIMWLIKYGAFRIVNFMDGHV